jgi:hypothetical protein
MASPYKTHWYHRRPTHWLRKGVDRPAGATKASECIRIDPAAGAVPSDCAPVRIYLGTEPGQYRATRVFVWSVMQVRDPARAYEIHLMSDLAGIDRTGWKTGFTNYRYAIPHLAGNAGRAIYNDVDQIYLSDPARLFDMEMDGRGVLAISEAENSVMLIDCAAMGPLWRLDDVQAGRTHAHFKGIVSAGRLFGRMPGSWNARDGEYPVEATDCLHYTTLHTQPWQPFPDQLRYRPSPLADVWHGLEASADRAGFLLFTADSPTREYAELLGQYRAMHDDAERYGGRRLARHAGGIAALIAETGAKTMLDYGAGKGLGYAAAADGDDNSAWRAYPGWAGVRVRLYDPGYAPIAQLRQGARFDGVISTDVVEHLAPWDVPWVLDRIFGLAERFVYVAAACYPARAVLPDGRNAHATQQPPHWWRMQMEMTARRHPRLRWQLVCEEKGVFGKRRAVFDGTSPSVAA